MPLVSTLFTVLKAAAGVMGFATFLQFMYEEALQTASIGVWALISNKEWEKAREQLDDYEHLVDSMEVIVRWFGWLSPTTQPSFEAYVAAAREQIESYRHIIDNKLGPPPEPKPLVKEEQIEEQITKKKGRMSKSMIRSWIIMLLSRVPLNNEDYAVLEQMTTFVSEKYYLTLVKNYGIFPMIAIGFTDEEIYRSFPEDWHEKVRKKIAYYRKRYTPYELGPPAALPREIIRPEEVEEVKEIITVPELEAPPTPAPAPPPPEEKVIIEVPTGPAPLSVGEMQEIAKRAIEPFGDELVRVSWDRWIDEVAKKYAFFYTAKRPTGTLYGSAIVGVLS